MIMRCSIFLIERGDFELFCLLSFEQKVRLIFRPVIVFLKEHPSLVFQAIHISRWFFSTLVITVKCVEQILKEHYYFDLHR